MTHPNVSMERELRPLLVVPQRSVLQRNQVYAAWERLGGLLWRPSRSWLIRRDLVCGPCSTIACYGGAPFCYEVSKRLGFRLVEPRLDALALLDRRWVKRSIEIRTLSSISHLDLPAFVKPVRHKQFSARIIGTLDQLNLHVGRLARSTAVLVSEIVSFLSEYRVLVLDGLVIDSSRYIGPEYENNNDSIIEFAELFSNSDNLPDVFVADIGLLDSGEFAIVELNPIWACAPLGCDVVGFVKCLSRSSRSL